MTIAIRELGLADRMMLEELLDAMTPGWNDRLSPEASGPTAFLTQPRSFVFGAYASNEPAGWVWGMTSFAPDGTMAAAIRGLAVRPEQRRQGIGTALLDAAVAFSRRQGCRVVELVAEANDGAADQFLTANGGRAPTGHHTRFSWEIT